MIINNPHFELTKKKWEEIYSYLNKIEPPSEIIKGKKYYNEITFQNVIRKTNNEFTRRYNINGNDFWKKLQEKFKKELNKYE